MIEKLRIGFIGGGQMAEAIIRGLLSSGRTKAERIAVSEPLPERRAYLEKTYPGLEVLGDNLDLVRKADLVVLAVKPQVMARVLEEIAPAVEPRHLVISIAAGIPLSFLEKRLPPGTRIIRVMPNTPALVLAGISAYTGGQSVSREDLELAQEFLSSLGEALELPESLFDAVTGLSGSGPAFVALFIEALTDGGVKMGLPRPVAEKLALETVLGTARLMKEAQKNPYELKAMVTSPGGTTICGIKALQDKGLPAAVMEAVEQATKRSQELSRLVEEE
ncbi:MAG: pyrroline-5-carboxylate reductase [Thermodesulfobacteria bacterium]|nr:pyrroline-5-carboxylate reductase [Thermodesulfobacteriota bacterium]